jgi:Ca2+-binding RTX toxin-like protein
VGSTNLADGLVSFELPNLLDPTGFSVSASDFEAFSAFDTDDPEAFFAAVVNAVHDLLVELDGLGGGALDVEIPVVEVNFSELTDFFGDLATEVQALVSTPAGGLGSLEALIELKIFEVLQDVGFIDDSIALPEIPDSEDFADLAAYEAALTTFLTDTLPTFLADNADFLNLSFEPGNGDAPALLLELSFDESQTITKPFNLDLGSLGVSEDLSSVVSAGGQGDLDLTYGVEGSLAVGLELDGLNSLPRPFLLDTTGISVFADGGLSGGEFEASVGPFSVRIGEANGVAESGTDCENATDDDGDGFINDGCPEVDGDSESGDQCLNNTDDDDDSAENDEVNDGCPFEFGASAEFRASFDVENDIDDDGEPDRVYFSGSGTQIGTWIDGILDGFDLDDPPLEALGGGPDGTTKCPDQDANQPAICASLPFFLDAGGTTIFIDEVTLALEGLDSDNWTAPDFSDVAQYFVDNAEDLALILLFEGIEAFLDFLEDSLDGASYDVDIPVLGDALDAGADIVGAFNDGVVMPINDAIAASGGANSDALDTLFTDALVDALGSGGLDILLSTDEDAIVEVACPMGTDPCSLSEITEMNVKLSIGQTSGEFSTPAAFDFGVPGLRFDLGGAALTAEGAWNVDVGFGISRTEGFYLLTDDTNLGVGADLDLDFGPDPIQGDIAFIQLLVTDGKDDPDDPEASISLLLDATGGGSAGKLPLSELLSGPDPLSFNPTVEPEVDLDFDIQTQFNVGDEATANAIPRLLATFRLGWDPGNLLAAGDPFASLTADFDEVKLDLGSFIAEFLAPALEDINRYLKPIQPVIDTISAPVPGIAQLAELVGEEPPTLLDLFESISGNDLTFIRRIIGIINFITAIEAVASDVDPGDSGCSSLCIDIGDFGLAAQELFKPALPASQRSKLIDQNTVNLVTTNVLSAIDSKPDGDFGGSGAAFKSEFSKSRTGGGFSFPAFQDPSQLFELIVGGNPTLIEWRSGLLKASFGFSQSFGPIFVGPIPISIVISGSAGVEGQFGIGYDTKGIRQLVEILSDGDNSNDSFFGGVSALLAGVFINDLDENGNDVPEIAFFAEIAAGAALDAVIVSAGIEGGIRAEITLNLHDGGYASPPPPENLDGKLRIDEIVSFVANPLCIFDVGGKLTAFLRAFVEIDLFLVSKKFAFTIVNITLLEFENLFEDACEPAEPEPATMVGANDDILRLNMGPFAGSRNFASGETEERFVLRQLDEDTVSVTAFGITKEYDGVASVFGNGGSDDDVIILETGVNAEVSETETQPDGEPAIDNGEDQQQDFVLPAVLCGGSGNDRILAGYGDDRVYGDGNNAGIPATATSCTDTDPNDDGDDTLTGNGGEDRVFGQGGNDIVTGDDGNDPELRGGEGDDEVVGGAGKDTIHGDGGNDVLLGGPEPEPSGDEADDTINGGDDDDSIEGDWGDDTLNGDDGNDIIIGNQGEDTISGGDDEDRILGNEDDDDIAGNEGDDEIQGNEGDDDIYGDDRNLASAASGRDDIVGGEGEDDVWGGPGEDVILGDLAEIFRDQASLGADPFEAPDDETPLFLLEPGAGFDDNLNGGDDADLIYGQGGDDTINGDDGDDDLHGNDGEDIMSGNAGADDMFGDAGDDEMWGDSATPVAAEDGADTMRGGNDDDTMRGNADGDSIFGDSGDDEIYGDAETPDDANDGSDTARGGPGDDLIFGNADGDFLFGDGDADRMIGGSSQPDESDGADTMSGGVGPDVMIGDNGTISAGDTNNPDDLTQKDVVLRLDDEGDGDTMMGDGAGDRMFGQTGGDVMSGNDGADYLEGNEGSDQMSGDDGPDDMVGGSSAGDGEIDANRDGSGRPDVGDDMSGGDDADYLFGDNARVERNFDLGSNDSVELFDVNSADTTVSGGDRMSGGAGPDTMFGQGNGAQDPEATPDAPDGLDNDLDGAIDEDGVLDLDNVDPWLGDAMFGGSGPDYIEGNHGADYLRGGGDNDDMVGGGSAIDGVIDADRNGTGLKDGRDSMHGDAGIDWMFGDNALADSDDATGALVQAVLFDVNSGDTSVSSGDYMRGGGADDVMFGQGNGTQGDQADPLDGGIDNDLDNDLEGPDEDQPWEGDVMFGDAGNDYQEGNHGSDLMYGDTGDGSVSGNDDMVGGGSANDGDAVAQTGTFVADRDGNGLADDGDVMFGEGGEDRMTGDNAFVQRNADLGAADDLVLFDVNSADPSFSGGDYMDGGDDDDRMFGQGNGNQSALQSDPLDGVDTDADGDLDEDQPWDGDVMLGGSDDDYMEGNHGADVMWGDDRDANTPDGQDDMIGGGSAFDGVIDDDRDGSGLDDRNDIMRGEGNVDFMGGDNAWIDRDGNLAVTGLVLPGSTDRGVALFDVEIVGDAPIPDYSGGDWMSGGDDPDVMFGQGNGAQPDDEADPLDGVDNDFDGREDGDPGDADDQGYDCADNGFDNDEDGDADGDDTNCTDAIDEDQPWSGDVMFGNGADDYMEGNHGADWMFGDDGDEADSASDGEDDMVGGGSAADGLIVPTRIGTDLKDGSDVMHGEGEDDVMTGDNARVNRVLDGADWDDLETADLLAPPPADGFGPYDITVRIVDMDVDPEQDGAYGDDYMTGDAGNDQMYGQLGSDFAVGNAGDDAIVGDLGQIRLNLIGDEANDPTPALIETQSPHWDASVYENGSLLYETELYSFDTSAGGAGGDDVLLGHDGRDTAFGGPGDDVINGDGDGVEEVFDAENPEFTHITDIDPATNDEDFLFGGDDDDAMWGGRGNDVGYGGHGEDYLDVRPREESDNGRRGANFRIIPRDPPAWFTWAFPENFQDVDFLYGGWDRDALQADQAANGPDPGDRLADWAGGFNVFYLCPAGYGDFTITRMGSPFAQTFLEDLARASGAFDTATDGTSGFRDVAYVFPNQRGQNSHPPHPDHPGHFTCADFSNVDG